MSQTPAPLTTDELQSLMWIATVTNRVALPAAHLETLLRAGYIHEGITGPVLTDLGERLLARRRARRTALGRHPCVAGHGPTERGRLALVRVIYPTSYD